MNNENSAKLKIAVVCHIFNPESGGGMETALYELLKELATLADITVITSHADNTARKLPVKFVFLPTIRSDILLARYFSFLFSWKLFRIFMQPERKYDVIYSSSLLFKGSDVSAVNFLSKPFLEILRRENSQQMPFIIKLKSLHRIYSHSVGARHESRILQRISGCATKTLLLPVSAGIADELRKHYNVPDNKMIIIPNPYNCIDPSEHSVETAKKEIAGRTDWNLDESFILLFAGGNWERKGLVDTIKCLKLLPESAKLIIAGEGNISSYKELCASLDITDRVLFLGRRKDMPVLYSISDLLVLLSSFEALPMVCIEAMSYGLPLVLYPFTGSETLVKNNVNGFTATNAKEAADGIIMLMKDPECYRRFSNASKDMASLFQSKKIAQDVLALCRNIYKMKNNEQR